MKQDVTVKKEPSDDFCNMIPDLAIQEQTTYDFLSGETPLYYFYLGLLTGSILSGEIDTISPIYFHVMSVPFLHKLLKRSHAHTIKLRYQIRKVFHAQWRDFNFFFFVDA
jgi:hypothetical protein